MTLDEQIVATQIFDRLILGREDAIATEIARRMEVMVEAARTTARGFTSGMTPKRAALESVLADMDAGRLW